MGGMRQLNLYPKLRYFPGLKIGMSEECLTVSPQNQTRPGGERVGGKQNFNLNILKSFEAPRIPYSRDCLSLQMET